MWETCLEKMLQSWGRPLGSWASFIAQLVKNLPAMQETQLRSLGQEDALKESTGNPLQYSCLENPMDREPGRLQPIGLQRVRCD